MSHLSKLLRKIPSPLRSKKALIILVVLLIVLWILTNGSANAKLITTAVVKQGDISSEVTASGSITSPNQSVLHFAVPGKVAYVSVKEGDRVKKGQVIAGLDSEKYQIAVREAQWVFEEAKAEFDRYYDDARGRSSETFDQRVDRTTIDLKQNNAYEALLLTKRNLRDTVVTAPFDGTVTSLPLHVGEEAQVTSDVAEVVDLTQLQFSADIDETDIGDVKNDQKVTLALDAFPDDKIPSAIKKVSQSSTTTSTGATAYKVDFTVPETGKYRLGMNGEATVLTDEEKNILVIPLEALVDDQFVWIKTPQGYEKKKIKLGIISDTEAQILSGVSDGAIVVTGGFEELMKKSLLDRLLQR